MLIKFGRMHSIFIMFLAVKLVSGLSTYHNRLRTPVSTISSVKLFSSSVDSNSEGRKSSGKVKQDEFTGIKIDLQPPKGTRDFYPEEHRLKSWLFQKWRNIAAAFCFEEYDAPVVESEELYTRKAGDEITQQLYNFEDKGGRRLALRPEMTPSLARMILAKKNSLSLPIKWFSIPQCWRYERMTRGRRREHYQWNMDIWGSEGIETEVELLSAVVTCFKDMGLTATDVGIKVNSRKLINDMMLMLGIPSDKWSQTCVLIDKLEKIPIDALEGELQSIGLQKDTVEKLLGYVNTTDINSLKTILGPKAQGLVDIENLLSLSDAYGFRDWIEFDASVIRGLSYYTGVVFEGFDRSKTLRAICGGGRYDHLLESLGGESLPAVGFGFGDAVIVELLKMKNLLPNVSKSAVDVMVFAMTSDLYGEAAKLATRLRAAGLKVELVFADKKPKWVFQRADKLGAGFVAMLAPDEFNDKKFVLKDLSKRTQSIYALDEAEAVLKPLLSASGTEEA